MNIRVKDYTGELSRQTFEGVSTIPDALGRIIKSSEVWSVSLNLNLLEIAITTVEELNRYVEHIMPAEYLTEFEEYKAAEIGIEEFSAIIDLLKSMEDYKDYLEMKIKVRVRHNIGKKSKKVFGEPGTILIIDNTIIRSEELYRNTLAPKYIIRWANIIDTTTDLLHNEHYLLRNDYATVFEEIDRSLEILKLPDIKKLTISVPGIESNLDSPIVAASNMLNLM